MEIGGLGWRTATPKTSKPTMKIFVRIFTLLRRTETKKYSKKLLSSKRLQLAQQKCDQTRIQNSRPHIEAQSKGDRARKINLKTLTIAYDLRLLCKAMYSYNEGICFIVGTQLTWNHVSPTSYNNTSHVSYF